MWKRAKSMRKCLLLSPINLKDSGGTNRKSSRWERRRQRMGHGNGKASPKNNARSLAVGGWPRLNSEKRLWVAYPLWVFTPPPHPAAFAGCVLCTPVVSTGANGGAVLLPFFLISI